VVTALTLDPKGEIPSLPSIGKPVSNTGIYILDKYGNLQPIGIQGELYIGGIQVGNGYLNRPELTAEKFRRVVISHSSLVIGSFLKTDDCSHSPHSLYLSYHRLYRTGDLAKWALDGNIQFLGRIDHQVKIRGFRIEPGEIETHLLNHEAIRDALVLVKEKPGKEKYLCAYIVAENAEKKSEIQVLREYLSKKLPDYMIPAYFIYVDGIPLTPNRKVDRKALPEPEIEVSLEKYLAPRDETEEKIAAIWSELLEIKKEKIGIESNFFELGGNSLNLIRLVSKMYKEFGTEVPVTQIYNNPTIKKISKLLQSKKYTEVPVVLLNQSKEKKIFCFPPQLGYGILYQHLANIIRDYSWYAFNFIEDIEDEERLNKYANFITNFQPVGPYILLGYSAARRLTIQAAKYLENLNYEVSDIILLDCFFSENENLPTREQIKKYLKHYYRTLDDFLERSDAMFLKEKVKTKSLKYMKYNLYDKKRLEKVNANIHLILSEDAQNNEQLDKKSWDKLTKNRSLIYKGLGTHVGMIDPGTIEKNAEIIKEILQGIESKHSQNID
jgi:acyl carrier protein